MTAGACRWGFGVCGCGSGPRSGWCGQGAIKRFASAPLVRVQWSHRRPPDPLAAVDRVPLRHELCRSRRRRALHRGVRRRGGRRALRGRLGAAARGGERPALSAAALCPHRRQRPHKPPGSFHLPCPRRPDGGLGRGVANRSGLPGCRLPQGVGEPGSVAGEAAPFPRSTAGTDGADDVLEEASEVGRVGCVERELLPSDDVRRQVTNIARPRHSPSAGSARLNESS